ncbi:MAG: hypothetical protein DWQ01_01225 [Planctomycetota bacterium]|nr:MAG: hypothetical protein DWQ01_01225 [Planctomycetota bacterium]
MLSEEMEEFEFESRGSEDSSKGAEDLEGTSENSESDPCDDQIADSDNHANGNDNDFEGATKFDSEDELFLFPGVGDVVNGQFEVVRQLKKGGMGIVYLVRERKYKNRLLCLKLNQRPKCDRSTRRFEREQDPMILIQHTNIGEIHSGGKCPKYGQYYVMPYYSGGNLREEVQRNGIYSERIPGFESLMKQTLSALIAVHDKGFIHKDIKPENILFDAGGTPKLCDFGLALVPNDDRLTKENEHPGTPAYMAPEQKEEGGEIDNRTDIFCLGATFFFALTGRDPGTHGMELPQKWRDIISKCMEKKQPDRFSSVRDMINHVEKVKNRDKLGIDPRSGSSSASDEINLERFGSLAGRFDFKADLSGTSYGVSCHAVDLKHNLREVVVKRIELSAKNQYFLDFTRNRWEWPAIVSLETVGVRRIIDQDWREEEGWLTLVMPFLPGKNLREYTRGKRNGLNDHDFYHLARELCLCLKEAHAKGAFHRNLKPENVVIGQDMSVKLMDFGLIEQFSKMPDCLHGYFSPEQREENWKVPGHFSDIYGLGALLCFALTGKDPEPDLMENLSSRWAKVVETCLQNSPNSRFQSAEQVGLEMEKIWKSDRGSSNPQVLTRTNVCGECKRPIEEGQRHCVGCGKAQVRFCPDEKCKKEIRVGQPHCDACGINIDDWETSSIWFKQALIQKECGNLDKAIKLLKRALRLAPKRQILKDCLEDCEKASVEIQLCIKRVRDHEKNQCWDVALGEIDGLANDYPGHKQLKLLRREFPARRRKAELKLALGQLDRAVKDMNKERFALWKTKALARALTDEERKKVRAAEERYRLSLKERVTILERNVVSTLELRDFEGFDQNIQELRKLGLDSARIEDLENRRWVAYKKISRQRRFKRLFFALIFITVLIVGSGFAMLKYQERQIEKMLFGVRDFQVGDLVAANQFVEEIEGIPSFAWARSSLALAIERHKIAFQQPEAVLWQIFWNFSTDLEADLKVEKEVYQGLRNIAFTLRESLFQRHLSDFSYKVKEDGSYLLPFQLQVEDRDKATFYLPKELFEGAFELEKIVFRADDGEGKFDNGVIIQGNPSQELPNTYAFELSFIPKGQICEISLMEDSTSNRNELASQKFHSVPWRPELVSSIPLLIPLAN